MALRCWPGAIARVIRDEAFPANVGALVIVLRRADPADYVSSPLQGEEWECKPLSRPMWAEIGPGMADCNMRRLAMFDRNLQPLAPRAAVVAEAVETVRGDAVEA